MYSTAFFKCVVRKDDNFTGKVNDKEDTNRHLIVRTEKFKNNVYNVKLRKRK